MKKTLVLFILCTGLFFGSIAMAGVEPSPFREAIQTQIDLIIERLTPLTYYSPTGESNEIQDLAIEVVNYLEFAGEAPIRHKAITLQAVTIMEKISAVLFDPQPEPPGYLLNALNTLFRLSVVVFDPQPEPPGHVRTSLSVLERVSAAGFDPQPEPPGHEALINTMDALNGISAIAFDPQPEPPGKASDIMGVFEAVTAITFDPQPEPPGQAADEMFRILNLIKAIAIPVEEVTLN